MSSRRRRLLVALLLAVSACKGDGSSDPTGPGGPSTIELTPSAVSFDALGETQQLSATVLDAEGGQVSSATVSWLSSNEDVSTVSSDGLVTAVSTGSAMITASSGAASGTASVDVEQIASAIELSPGSLELQGPGDTATVAVSVMDDGGSPIDDLDITWSSDDEGVTTVTDAGFVTAVGSGSATLTANVEADGTQISQDLSVSVEDGVLAGSAGGEIAVADGAATLELPSGAVSEPVFVTADEATDLPAGAAPLAAFDFGPDGLVFDEPVMLTLEYDPADLLPSVSEADLRLYKMVGGSFEFVDGSTVDEEAQTVSGEIGGFSVYAILQELTVTTESLPDGVVGASYNQALSVSGGSGSYIWSLASGSLPAGLSLSANGVLSGTPTTAGTSSFSIQVVSSGQTAQRALSVTVSESLAVSSSSLPIGIAGSSYQATLAATGGTGEYEWAVVAGALPSGLALGPTTGAISGTPNTAGLANFTVRVTSGSQQVERALSIQVYLPLTVTTTAMPNGAPGLPYSATLEAAGGDGSYTWSVTSGALPSGLTLNPSSGEISGTPTGSGSAFTVQVATGDGQSDKQALAIEVSTELTVFTTSLLDGVTGAAYSEILEASGGDGSYEWSLDVGSLPAGLSLGSDGVIDGTPTAVGTSNFTVEVESGGQAAQQALSITVRGPVDISTTSLPTGVQGEAYSQSLAATGGDGSYIWTLASGALPDGLRLSGVGNISGSTTATGTFDFTVEVTSLGQTDQQALSITVFPQLAIITTTLPEGIEHSEYGPEFLSASGGDGSYVWTVPVGTLPTDLVLSSDGEFTGTPTAAGTSDFTVEVASGDGQTTQRALSITVQPILVITTASLPDAAEDEAYGPHSLNATGGDGEYSWSVTSGSVPEGMRLATNGQITGTPTSKGTFNFTVEVTDGTQTAEKALSIMVGGPPGTVTDLAVVDQTSASLTVQFTEVDDGLGGPADYAIRHAVAPMQWGQADGSEMVVQGTQVGATHEVTIEELSPETEYDVRLVAYRGVLNQDAVFSDLSNLATGTTTTPPVLSPSDLCSDYPAHAIPTFEDAELDAAVRRELGITPEESYSCEQLGALATLSASYVQSLEGLQNATGLLSLGLSDLYSETEFDLTPVASLTSLTSLSIWFTHNLTDIGPIANLENLTGLTLYQVFADDYRPLSGLTSLRELALGLTNITDLSPLEGMADLERFIVWEGYDLDLTAVSGLPKLSDIYFFNVYNLTDIQGLLDNPDFGHGDTAGFQETSIPCADVAALRAKGVDATSDCLSIATTSLPNGEIHFPYSETLEANNLLFSSSSDQIGVWEPVSVPGPLPPGLTLSPNGEINLPYSGTLEANNLVSSSPEQTGVWELASGSGPLPPGLTLSPSGEISGVPSEAGTWAFTVFLQGVWLRTAQQELSITVVGQPATAPETVNDLTIVGRTSTSITVEFTEVDNNAGGAADYEVRHAPSPMAWGLAHESAQVVSGTQVGARRQVTISDLSWPTEYDVQLVAFRGTLNVDAIFSNLSNIVTSTVEPPSHNLSVDGVYLNQGNQSPGSLAGGVSGRPGLIRVAVRSNLANDYAPDVLVRLYQGTVLLREERVFAPQLGVPREPDPAEIGGTWDLILSASDVVPDLGVEVVVDPDGTVPDANPSDNVFPLGGGPASLDVRELPPLDVVFIPIQGSGGVLPAIDEYYLLDRTWKWIPTSSMLTAIHSPFSTDVDLSTDAGWSSLLSDIQALRTAEGATDEYYHGVIGQLPRSPRWGGLAYLPGSPSSSSRSAVTYAGGGGNPSEIVAHELGHNLGRRHAPCGNPAGVDPNYPHSGGVIGVAGFDIVVGDLKSPTMRDYMSYCGPEWTSDYTYRGIRDWRLADPLADSPSMVRAATSPPPTSGLLIWGRINSGGVTLNPAFALEASPALPAAGGVNSLRGLAADGSEIFGFSFEAETVADSPDPNEQHFAFFVPLSAASMDAVNQIIVNTPRGMAERISAVAPAGVAAPLPAESSVTVSPMPAGQVRVEWDAARYPMAMIRDEVTGQILGFARGGRLVADGQGRAADQLQVIVSDGVSSRPVDQR